MRNKTGYVKKCFMFNSPSRRIPGNRTSCWKNSQKPSKTGKTSKDKKRSRLNRSPQKNAKHTCIEKKRIAPISAPRSLKPSSWTRTPRCPAMRWPGTWPGTPSCVGRRVWYSVFVGPVFWGPTVILGWWFGIRWTGFDLLLGWFLVRFCWGSKKRGGSRRWPGCFLGFGERFVVFSSGGETFG